MSENNLPNIIFILIDDMGWKDLSCYNSSFYETPNIDRLAGEGMRFTDAYAASPVCSPTRASILCGKYPVSIGITDWIDFGKSIHPCKGKLIDAPYVDHLPINEISIASTLKSAGYQTWHVGKWHLGKKQYYPEHYGFDINIGGCDWGMPVNGYFSPYGIETLKDGPDGEYLTDRLTNEAIALLTQNKGKPFFLNLWYYAVHTPIQAKKEDIKRFEIKAKQMGLDLIPALEEGEHMPCEHNKHKRVVRRRLQSDPDYAAMIYNLDWNIGRLMAALTESGQMDNSVIFFTSDNGGLATAGGSPTCNSPLSEGKGWMYEGGVREPLIVKWPDVIRPGSICNVPVISPDFYPTILDIAGISTIRKQDIDGISIVQLLKGENTLDRGALYWHYPHYANQGGTPGCSIRINDFKLIEFFEDQRLELYDLAKDIGEEHDLADVMPELAQKMHMDLINWRKRKCAKLPLPNTLSGSE